MATRVHCDASGFEHHVDTSDFMKEIDEEVKEAVEEANKATAYADQQLRQANIPGVRHTPLNIRVGDVTRRPQGGSTVNQFNITGGTIGQAAIGNTGPTTFNQEKKVFKEGAQNSNIKITGGNFAQANVGGSATYNNKDTVVNTGTGSGGDGGEVITPEQLVLLIFEKGVSTDDFARLLEARYSLANIAFSMPGKDPGRRNRMIRALLAE